ncbi:MAG: FAD-dependent oxidoreductase, partial [Myxococcota bacterium]
RLDADSPAAAARLDDRSLADFARLYFGRSVLERWMAPSALRGAPGDPDEMSRAQYLFDFQRHGFQRAGLARMGLGEVVERAAAELPLRVDCPVRGLKWRKDGCLSVSLERSRLRADAVVLATDSAEALRIAEPLLSAAERDFLAGVRYLPCVAVAAALCRPLDSRPREIWVPQGAASPLQTLLVEPGVASGRVPQGRGFAWLRATPAFSDSVVDVPDGVVEKEMLAAFDEIWPGALRSVDFSHFFRTMRGAPSFGVGHYRALSRFARVRRDRRAAGSRVYFAGDQLVHPSYEGAVLSAERVTDAVCEDLLP